MAECCGLYIHIPFCKSPCGYCDFYKTKSESVDDEFVDLLLKEASLYSEDDRIKVDTLYFGGGTPSLLSPFQLEKIFRGLSEVFDFSDDLESTLEANPETLSSEKIKRFKEIGINRLSIGIQSLNDEVLKTLQREVRRRNILEKLKIVFNSEFNNISFDLIIGSPNSSIKSVLEDLSLLTTLPFVHSSLYILDIHRETRLFEEVKNGLKTIEDDEIAEIYENCSIFLEEKNFIHYEISNFAKRGFECRHNLKYWKGEEYIGIGPSSYSFFRNYRTKNPSSLVKWKDELYKGNFPFEEVAKESEKKRKENKIIFGLRLKEGIDLDYLRNYIEESDRDFDSLLSKLKEGALIKIENERISLTLKGYLLSNEIITFLLSKDFLSEREFND